MTKEELVKDKYYVVKYTDEYIMQFDGQMNGYCNGYIHKYSSFVRDRGSFRFHTDCIPVRECTPLEIHWLELCRKTNGWVNKPTKLPEEEIINNYTLY